MALVLANKPDYVGLKAFLDACNCSPTTLNETTGFHHVVVGGVNLRLTPDMEYVVEQDIFAERAVATMAVRKQMTTVTYRVRAAYSTTRIESQVGRRRLLVYRKIRKDDKAAIFFSKSRALGGKTPPPAMAISILRYYIDAVGVTVLGLDKYPEFLDLVNKIELLPRCAITEALHGKWRRHITSADTLDNPDPQEEPDRMDGEIRVEDLEDEMSDIETPIQESSGAGPAHPPTHSLQVVETTAVVPDETAEELQALRVANESLNKQLIVLKSRHLKLVTNHRMRDAVVKIQKDKMRDELEIAHKGQAEMRGLLSVNIDKIDRMEIRMTAFEEWAAQSHQLGHPATPNVPVFSPQSPIPVGPV